MYHLSKYLWCQGAFYSFTALSNVNKKRLILWLCLCKTIIFTLCTYIILNTLYFILEVATNWILSDIYIRLRVEETLSGMKELPFYLAVNSWLPPCCWYSRLQLCKTDWVKRSLLATRGCSSLANQSPPTARQSCGKKVAKALLNTTRGSCNLFFTVVKVITCESNLQLIMETFTVSVPQKPLEFDHLS